VLSVVGGPHLDGRDVTAVLVEAVLVEPLDPFGGGEFDLLDAAPGFSGFDQFGFV
jgi:hypothetical protein